ncbi:MAG: hypothetical protein QNJ53_25525 [Pleurocapsa sp. MO_192.B19]|nr:hypothetical protein [Pleurocapsa sp. MO_192.B19]
MAKINNSKTDLVKKLPILQPLQLEQLENIVGGAKENGQGTVECPACLRIN